MIKPKALYIHIPFCNYLCDYCDFAKLQYSSFFISRYLKALKDELVSYKIGELDTIYVGGGTPTSLNFNELKSLLEIIKPYSYGVKEYTFEANPDSLDIEKIKLLKEYGVNRISIGVQTTSDNVLKSINRHHTFNDVVTLVNNLKETGINNINIDLILGLPEVDIKQFEGDLNNVLTLDVNHISCYSLTVNPHTVFAIKGVKELSDDMYRNYYDLAKNLLTSHGYVHYEISNFAKDGFYSIHNLTYWKNERYYGVGLGASGYIDNIRYTNTRSITNYIKGQFVYSKEVVDSTSNINYQLMTNLRTKFGIDLTLFKNKFNVDLYEAKKGEIDTLISQKLLKIADNHLIPTYEGMMILDSILLKLFF